MKPPQQRNITTIKLKRKTKERLDKLKVHKRDSYDEIVQRVLGILNTCRSDPDNAQEKLENLEQLRKRNKVV
ncbi:MAG: hypothetical protein KJ718_00265 [Nanoarchaeota archaeon]|nr:hypothetical protein [Nanoarchaeota archaeon]MBU1050974.1 hypothetical protein [Nanoarchaeota archaeon]MBU1989030.1 hypothetical protein [Nanoarchaeota archaeon]